MGALKLRVDLEAWALCRPFRIAGRIFKAIDVVVVRLERDGCCGWGEAAGVFYMNDMPAAMVGQIEQVRPQVEAGISRETLQKILPPGGARNALDCALWDLEAKCSGETVWDAIGIEPKPVTTAFTIGIEDTPQAMAARAAESSQYPVLKIKLDGERPVERVAAIRAARPDARLLVDANQSWTFEQLAKIAPQLADLGIIIIEQPLPRGNDAALENYICPIPLVADESCLHRGELDQASRRYQIINIKLDKAGGLTEALLLAQAARDRGLGLMVGNMGGTSLGMSAAFVIAQLCDDVDLDGALLLRQDRAPGLRYQGGQIAVPDAAFWG